MTKVSTTRSLRGVALLAVAAGLLAGWMAWDYQSAVAEVRVGEERLGVARRQAAEIVQLRNQPRLAATHMIEAEPLNELISRAREAAKFEERAVERVDPRSPARWRDSAYLLRPVVVHLRSLPLEQIIKFVSGLGDVEQALWVNQLRLTPLRRDQPTTQGSETWNAELTLTQVIFSPKTP